MIVSLFPPTSATVGLESFCLFRSFSSSIFFFTFFLTATPESLLCVHTSGSMTCARSGSSSEIFLFFWSSFFKLMIGKVWNETVFVFCLCRNQ